MKKRLGFVPNSSSSSYVCVICSSIKSGWDLCLEDAEMKECEYCGSIFDEYCLGKLYKEGTEEYKRKQKRDNIISKKSVNRCSKCDKIFNEETVSYECSCKYPHCEDCDCDDDDRDCYIKTKDCPVCNLDFITQNRLYEFLLAESHRTEEELKEIIRARNNEKREIIQNLNRELFNI